jgi:hypothetical protein
MHNYFTDSGHGWLEVPRAELVELNILNKISGYSYQQGDMVYLEEDCDASTYCDARGITRWADLPTRNINSKYSDSPVRSYGRFTL